VRATRRRSGDLRRRLGTVGAVAAGGAAGTAARVELSRIVPAGPGVAWETFVVNVAGSFLLGLVATLLVERVRPAAHAGALLATGFCGAFTTFSTYAVEVDLRLQAGDIAAGLGDAAATLVAGLAAVVAGVAVARGLRRREAVERRWRTRGRESRWS
jgi:CrcB protein